MNPNIGDILATTAELRSAKYSDLISASNVLWNRLKAKGNIKTFSGASEIRERLLYAGMGNFTRYQGYEFLNVKPAQNFTEAQFPIKQAAVSVSVSGEEELKNSGKAQLIDLVAGKFDAAEIDLMNNMNIDAYSDGSADGGRQIGGLGVMVSTSPANGIYAGINRVTWQQWRNKAFQAVADFGAPTTKDNIVDYLSRIAQRLSYGAEGPDLAILGASYFGMYNAALADKQRIVSDGGGTAGVGFTTLKFYGGGRAMDIALEGVGQAGDAGPLADKRAYFLTTRYINIRAHEDRNFDRFGGKARPVNQDAWVEHIGFAGNMTTSNAARQAVFTE